MLKLAAKSKRGQKELRRHGVIWMPVKQSSAVPCLNGKPGIQVMSVQDRATFWICLENDPNLVPVARVDPWGNELRTTNLVPQRSINGDSSSGGDLSRVTNGDSANLETSIPETPSQST